MKRAILFYIFLTLPTHALAYQDSASNAKLVSEFYSEIFENKNINLMNNYISKDVMFYNNFDAPANYNTLRNHLLSFDEQCLKCKVLPIDITLTTKNKVVSLYTQICTDKSNHINKKRIMAILEINKENKISTIWVVSHEK